MSTTPGQPAGEGRFHRYVTLLEHIGQVGADKIVPFADNIGSFVNGFAPGTGPIVAKIIKAVGQAQADAYQAGSTGNTGPQKLSHVLAAVSGDVAKTLDDLGRPSDTTAVTQAVESAVSAMKAMTIPVPIDASSSVQVSQPQAAQAAPPPAQAPPPRQVTPPATAQPAQAQPPATAQPAQAQPPATAQPAQVQPAQAQQPKTTPPAGTTTPKT